MNIEKHNIQEVFITATGLAALVHSTWALGTIFSGEQPAIESITTWIQWIHFAGWLIPALLIAFALDIGQISTSNQIRQHGITVGRGITFAVFALATFYLQWLYMVHHIPLISIGAGVSSGYMPTAIALRNLGLFVVPALLPLGTILYTFSGHESVQNEQPKPQTKTPEIRIEKPQQIALPLSVGALLEAEYPTFDAVCVCGWTRTYDNADSQAKGLRAHQRNCTVSVDSVEVEVAHGNA